MSALITVFIGLFGGVIGWWFTNYVFHPWKEVQELRRKARFETIYWNVMARSQTPAQGEPAREAFRKVAFELIALNEISPRWFKWLLKLLSYDLAEAADGMIRLSYGTVGDIDFPIRALSRHSVEKALGLQMEFSNEDCEQIRERWARERGDGFDDDGPGPNPVDGLFM